MDPAVAESDLSSVLPLERLPEPTPIGQLVRKRPWLYLRFLAGDIPD